MSAGSDVDARSLADGWALADVAEFERLFRDLVGLIGRAERVIPPQARHTLQRAVVAAADAALDHGGSAATMPDLSCLDAWRSSMVQRSRPQQASAGTARRPVPPRGPYDSAGEWIFL